uniref:hypothetical chloroplast RF66 n=1 Tax=Pallavicinia lyellii TaxID=56939 RepID=UPI001D10EA15|nr:hypothetical chloroplast RF66 [Pallavicinia lyellii]QZZ24683.1 hypothetical chloroplast RF66 [Pallavicinia lyellii]QZZ24767.1 hypothetical chloroplast RF66 [Pallavicinia lyellii]
MNHVELGPSTVVGIGLIIVGMILYAPRIREPGVSRYYDFLFSSIGLLCGGILFFQGWRLDPILLLSQILLSGTTVFFIAESLYLRNNSNRSKNYKDINISSDRKIKLYQSLRLDNNRKWNNICYTVHVCYGKVEKQGH